MKKFITKSENGYTLGYVDTTETGRIAGYKDYVRKAQNPQELEATHNSEYIYGWDDELDYITDIIALGGEKLNVSLLGNYSYCIMTADDEIIDNYWSKLENAYSEALKAETEKEAAEKEAAEKFNNRVTTLSAEKGLTLYEAYNKMKLARNEYNNFMNEGGSGYIPAMYFNIEQFLLSL